VWVLLSYVFKKRKLFAKKKCVNELTVRWSLLSGVDIKVVYVISNKQVHSVVYTYRLVKKHILIRGGQFSK
jgi:hypothetical protein